MPPAALRDQRLSRSSRVFTSSTGALSELSLFLHVSQVLSCDSRDLERGQRVKRAELRAWICRTFSFCPNCSSCPRRYARVNRVFLHVSQVLNCDLRGLELVSGERVKRAAAELCAWICNCATFSFYPNFFSCPRRDTRESIGMIASIRRESHNESARIRTSRVTYVFFCLFVCLFSSSSK